MPGGGGEPLSPPSGDRLSSAYAAMAGLGERGPGARGSRRVHRIVGRIRVRPCATIRIGELNIEYGGTVVDWDQTVAAAEALDADVIAIEEAWGHIPRLAEAMG